jgi:hypothetical protein
MKSFYKPQRGSISTTAHYPDFWDIIRRTISLLMDLMCSSPTCEVGRRGLVGGGKRPPERGRYRSNTALGISRARLMAINSVVGSMTSHIVTKHRSMQFGTEGTMSHYF